MRPLWRIFGGIGLVAVSVVAAIVTMAWWIRLLQTIPAESWLIFGVGLSVSTAAALWGVWILLGVFRDREESHSAPQE
ncbi:MAG: hypothetical protein IVW51_02040 [Thermaceae bacterium]|nr:hypothetical protein [Thermaceae bacterium]